MFFPFLLPVGVCNWQWSRSFLLQLENPHRGYPSSFPQWSNYYGRLKNMRFSQSYSLWQSHYLCRYYLMYRCKNAYPCLFLWLLLARKYGDSLDTRPKFCMGIHLKFSRDCIVKECPSILWILYVDEPLLKCWSRNRNHKNN